MTVAHINTGSPIQTRRLRAALERGLATHFPAESRIIHITRRPSPYRTSYALEEIRVRLAGGRKLELLFKDCSREALTKEAALAKPDFLIDPRRELAVYRHWLGRADLGTPILYADLIDEPRGTFGLFLEHVHGRELYQVGQIDLWQAAARWLARFHAHFADAQSAAAGDRLLRYDADRCWTWLDRANRVIAKSDRMQSPTRAAWKCIVSNFAATIDRLASLPTTLIHGEFFASNVLIAGAKTDSIKLPQNIKNVRVCAIDWEMAAVGPGLLDLAALVAGSWSEQQRATLAVEYFKEFRRVDPAGWASEKEFWFNLTACRLHLAVQRIGWAAGWIPPAEHRYDWGAEATQLAQRIGM